jgi:LacI family transcriptional regulator
MGFDNQSILPDRYRGPEITTVEQPLYTIGMDSIRLVSERLSNNDAKMPVRKTYETKIIERETVCEYQG